MGSNPGVHSVCSRLSQEIILKLSVCGPPLSGGRLSQSQPEWMDPSPQVLGIQWRIHPPESCYYPHGSKGVAAIYIAENALVGQE